MKKCFVFCALTAILCSSFSSLLHANDVEEWKRLDLSNPPPPRYCHAQIYDAKRNIMTIFGGWTYESIKQTYAMFDDTWQADFSDSTWTKIETDIKPSPRGAYALLDSLNNRLLLLGGFALSGNDFNIYDDLWAFDLNNLSWNLLSPDGESPTNIGVATPVYDMTRNRIVFFGGEAHDPPYEALDVTWSLDLNHLEWKKIEPNGTRPPARWGHAAIYDAEKDRMIFFGGKYEDQNFIPDYLNDMWALNFGTNEWQKLLRNSAKCPSARSGIAMIHDRPRDRLVLFGGAESEQIGRGSLNDTWVFDLSTLEWQELTPAGDIPTGRSYIVASDNRSGNSMLLFGGNHSFAEMLNDTYELCFQKTETDIYEKPEFVSQYALQQIYPNPFNPVTTISYTLPKRSDVSIHIHDIRGELVATLVNEKQMAGQHKITWNAYNLPSGTYFIRMKTENFMQTNKCLLLR